MVEQELDCPECAGDLPSLDRRGFMRTIGAGLGAAGVSALLTPARARADSAKPDAAKPEKARPAEELVKELHAGFSDEQKKNLVLPYNHGIVDGKGRATRLGM